MSYSIYYSRQSEKYLARLTPSKIRKILSEIEKIAADPHKLGNNLVKLTGTNSSFRLRLGDLRIIYYLDDENKSLYIIKIAPRGSAYTS